MDLHLQGKKALVTGSTRGIGRAIATALAREGAAVAVHGRRPDDAERVAREIESDAAAPSGRISGVAGDLSTDDDARQVFDAARSAIGGIDVLVNNAGTFEAMGWADADAKRWAETYDVNVLSMVRLVRLALPAMRQAGWGRIVGIASISASIAPPVFPDYAAAKAATLNLTLSLMQEAAGTGVTVNTISPGPVVTETWKGFALEMARAQGWDEDLESVKTRLLGGIMANPCGRLGRPEDVAELCAFLASPLAGYVNGANIPVTGGLAARMV